MAIIEKVYSTMYFYSSFNEVIDSIYKCGLSPFDKYDNNIKQIKEIFYNLEEIRFNKEVV